MTRRLLLLRHAKSSWADDTIDDHERPLNQRGQRDAPRMGQLLRDLDAVPDVIRASSARRAQETAHGVISAWAAPPLITTEPALYHAPVDTILDVVRGTDDACASALVVGHNPGIGELMCVLVNDLIAVPTATLCVVECAVASWRDLGRSAVQRVVGVWRPKEL